ncbi:hypothetical protein QTH97_02715 [Variovorax sp. J22R24]|uniref:hypothetical protein n=1 Tax=Variovorax gracilis TaxID=3053502 RepID=UPI002577F613|nr:hypothetical protein [Variovorax sp. J22R24]MDM0103829.1 hypothetical protein [Variovorax sp. J22R24]
MGLRTFLPVLTVAVAATWTTWAPPAAAQAGASALRATYDKLAPGMASSPFGRPMVLNSAETANGLKGEVFGVLDHPLGKVSAALSTPKQWCEMLMLHLNNRACRVDAAKQTLTLSVVRRYDVPIDDAFELTFNFQVVSAKPDYFNAKLTSGKGPFGTRNYRISLEGIPVGTGKSFVQFSYAYDQGSATRAATRSYLATLGRGKVGFTVVKKQANGEPELMGGMLGLMERNAMRYFLALDAYLSAPDDFEKRLALWYASVEKYPRQLHDLDEAEYLELKRMDRKRQSRARP